MLLNLPLSPLESRAPLINIGAGTDSILTDLHSSASQLSDFSPDTHRYSSRARPIKMSSSNGIESINDQGNVWFKVHETGVRLSSSIQPLASILAAAAMRFDVMRQSVMMLL